MSSPPAPGIDLIYKSNNYSFWEVPSIDNVRAAHAWLLECLETNGPYDTVCCFSQGCALVATFLLYHTRESPQNPLPFQRAIFICGGIPLPVLDDLGLPISTEAYDINEQTSLLLKRKAGAIKEMVANVDKIPKGAGLWDDTTDLLHDPTEQPDPSDVFGLDFTLFPKDLKISIPTLHIYGAKDPRWPSSLQLVHFCRDPLTFDHGGGHEIPRSSLVSEKIADLVKSLSAM